MAKYKKRNTKNKHPQQHPSVSTCKICKHKTTCKKDCQITIQEITSKPQIFLDCKI